MRKRIERINQLIKKELSKLIFREIDLPKDVLVTLTRVETTKDLRESKVFVSSWPREKNKEVLEALKRNIYFLQKELDRKFEIKRVPKIAFFDEKKLAKVERIEEILENLKKDKK